jgi:Holliday junction resolvase RusA-like endonuclease
MSCAWMKNFWRLRVSSGLTHILSLVEPIKIVVYGTAAPAGSKTSFALKRKDGSYVKRPDGRIIVNTADSSKRSKPWKEMVAQAAGEQYDGELLDGPLAVEIRFFRPHAKSHYGSGRNAAILKQSSPLFPTMKPDVLKLARGVEDALSGVVYRDDSQIVREFLEKGFDDPARCEIIVTSIPWATVGDAEHVNQRRLAEVGHSDHQRLPNPEPLFD